MPIPVESTSPVSSILARARRTDQENRLSEQSQSTRDFLEMDEMTSDLVSSAQQREQRERVRNRIEQYSHSTRIEERLRAEEATAAEADRSQEAIPADVTTQDDIAADGDRVEIRQAEEILRGLDELERLIETTEESETADEFVPKEDSPATPIPEHPRVAAFAWPSAVVTDPCVICGSSTAQRKFAIEGVSEQLVECDSCGIGSLFPMPDSARIQSFYPAEYYGTPTAKFEPLVESGVRAGSRARVRSLLAGIPDGSNVLDVGCGRGVMLRAALDLGYTAHGVEISEEAAAGVDLRAHIRIASDLAEAGYETNSMDAVVLWHVLEHLPQPGRTLAEIRRILKPGGRLVLAVPNYASWQSRWAGADWFHLDLPRHLYHFSPDTLSILLHRYGFAKQTYRHFAALQNPFGWLQSAFNRASGSPRNSLYSLLHRGGDHEDARSLSPAKRFLFKAAFAVGLPIAAAVSFLEAAFSRGGTIAVTAELGYVDDHVEPAAVSRQALAAAF
jgi:SAM-dependent methyltransferase